MARTRRTTPLVSEVEHDGQDISQDISSLLLLEKVIVMDLLSQVKEADTVVLIATQNYIAE